MNKNDKEKLIVLFLGAALLFCVIWYSEYTEREKHTLLKKSFAITLGKITSIGSRGRFGSNAKYQYFVAKKSYEGDIIISRFCTRCQDDVCVLNKLSIPVIYSLKKPDVSSILLKHSEYRTWDLVYPDSLKRYLEFYFECGRSYLGDKREGIKPNWRKCDE